MNEIEFLPKKFRERRARNNIRVSRTFVLLLLAAAMALVTIYQLSSLRRVQVQLADLEDAHAQVAQLMAEVDLKREEVHRLRHYARLLTFLEHPYPKSQIVASLANLIPPEMVITQMHLSHPAARTGAFQPLAEADTSKMPAMEQDLQKLVHETRTRRCTVELEGTTEDTSALYEFLARLHQLEIVESAKIESVDPRTGTAGTEISNFTAHIKIKPGHARQFEQLLGQITASRLGEERVR